MIDNNYSKRPIREQYAAARWFVRTRQGAFIAMPSGIPKPVWDAAAAVSSRRLKDSDPRDPLAFQLWQRRAYPGCATDWEADKWVRRYAVGRRSHAKARVLAQQRAATRRSGLFIEFQDGC